MVFVAIMSALLTVLSLFMLGLTTLEVPARWRHRQVIPWPLAGT
jgi:thiol:disulfide interchange protein